MKTFWATSCFLIIASTASAQTIPSYARDVKPFLAKYCAECHNAQVHKAGLNLESLQSILAGSDHGVVLTPGQADKSLLVALVEKKEKPIMPPKSAKFQPGKNEIALLRAWVHAGAKDDGALAKTVVPNISPRRWLPDPVVELAFHDKSWHVATTRGIAKLAGNDREPLASLPGDKDGLQISAVTATPHGLLMAFGRPGQEGFLTLHSGAAWKSQHRDSVLTLAISGDGKFLASGGYDSLIHLWSLPDRKHLRTFKEHSDAVNGLAFSPDGALLASASADRAVKIWSVAEGKLLYTLGEATDWVYSLAWSRDGKYLAAGSADKSIRLYHPGPAAAKLVHSVFAHDGPVHKLAFTHDSQTLFSMGQDRVVKSWEAYRMTEKKVFDPQSETVLALALSTDDQELAVGRFDGIVQIFSASKGVLLRESRPQLPKTAAVLVPGLLTGLKSSEPVEEKSLYSFPTWTEKEPNNSPSSGQPVKTPATIHGSLEKTGETDYYRIEGQSGFQLGMHLQLGKGSKIEPYLQVFDERGRLLADSSRGHLGFTFPRQGTFVVGVRDREFRGGADHAYRLHLGPIPLVNSIHPMGLQQGTEVHFQVEGVHLTSKELTWKAPVGALIGSKQPLPITSKSVPLGNLQVVVGEFPEIIAADPGQFLAVPGTANGRLEKPGQEDVWSFAAKKGQRLILEVNARRLGSNLDSFLEILDARDQPVERAVLRCQAKTFVTFRDHDSAVPGIRIDAWDDLSANDWIFGGQELMKIRALPTHPDADCSFFSEAGNRIAFLDTTPTHHSMGTPMYKVGIHAPGSTFPPNGFPLFKIYYRNDDGGPGLGRDSRLFFDPAADGIFKVRIGDTRRSGGSNFGYRLTVRPPRPSFNIRFTPTSPTVCRGSGVPLTISAERLDGFEGEIQVSFVDVPAGLNVPATSILPGESTTAVGLFADAETKKSEKAGPLKLIGSATIAGQKVFKEALGGVPILTDPGEIVAATVEDSLLILPGGQAKMTVHIERRHGFKGRVPVEVRGLPHGVRVLDIGLNGILITERETSRTMVLYAEPWVEATRHPFVVLARHEGKKTEHAAKSVMLEVQKRPYSD